MTPEGYALALTWAGLAPLEIRAGLLAFLSDFEPHPAELKRTALELHRSGHFRAGQLTPEGVREAKEALYRVGHPPGSIGGEV